MPVEAPRAARAAYDPARIERAAGRRCRAIVEHAYRFVPHYREAIDRLGLRPAELDHPAALSQLPLIDRSDLQESPERFLSTAGVDLIELRTGGSTGKPLIIMRDRGAAFRGGLVRERRRVIHLQVAGRRLRLRTLNLGTELSGGGADQRRPLLRRVRVAAARGSIFDPMENNVGLIESHRPDLVVSFGSYLEALMNHIDDRGGADHLPTTLLYGGDEMPEAARERIQERFGIPSFSAYGAVEAPDIAFECEAHLGLHVNEDVHPVRIVDASGREAPMGESGEVVVSNLVSYGTVLLNYRLGDLAKRIEGPCPCGRTLPLISRIEGRRDDWIQTRSGLRVHPQRLRTIVAGEAESVRAYQIEQRGPDAILLRWVPRSGLGGDQRASVEGRLRRRISETLGDRATARFEQVEELPRTRSGKVLRVIREPEEKVELRAAREDELDAILEVMRPANMHRRSSQEMPELDLHRFTVAELDGEVIGAAGWVPAEPGVAKTTLLAVLPSARGLGVGERLQRARMEQMAAAGADVVRTNADRPATIAWYRKHFGYVEVGKLAKVDEFGDPGIDEWTTLEAPLKSVSD